MYIETHIAKLSKPQILKLLKGERIRIKKGSHHKFHLTKHQLHGLETKHAMGKAHTIQYSPDQISKYGSGLMQDVYNFVKRTPYIRDAVNSGIRAGKKHLHHGVNYLSAKAHQKIGQIPMIGEGLHRRRRRTGHGLGGMALSGGAELAGLIGGPGSDEAKKVLGTLGGVANFLGLGIRGRKKRTTTGKRKATPAQLQALARGRATRDANRLHRRSGGALYVA
jgi:hypothetical protein